MKAPIIAFFNNKGGVGKTSLVYHLAWMYSDLGVRVLAADLDPQANLTAAFIDEDELGELWEGEFPTIARCVDPLVQATGDIGEARTKEISDNLALLLGDLALSAFEGHLSDAWPRCPDSDPQAFRIMSAFYRIMQNAAQANGAGVILMDLGPNLGAINRAALIAADYVVFPLSGDLFSLQGLRNLGPTLAKWRQGWTERIAKNPVQGLLLPEGRMQPAGYIVLQHSVRLDRPVKAYDQWIARIPATYCKYVEERDPPEGLTLANDPRCLALLKHYGSLMPMAQEARKPMFHLKPADGAIGAHFQAAQSAYQDFKRLAAIIAERTGLSWPVFEHA
jgi:chromosome partitioning protein